MIQIDQIHKTYGTGAGSHQALRGVSIDVPQGSLVTFLGPSGCGKSTTLRSIAGLESPDSGRIEIGARTVFDSASRTNVPPERRRLGMVFQSYAIWPHMTVAQNVAYPLKSQRVRHDQVESRVDRALELVGLAGQASRPAPNLSGGQQQRVALARAIVAEPEVLLLDEPLSNLDAKLRDEMRGELQALQARLGMTMCFVTHDQVEALALSDQVVLMRDGRVVESGPPRQLYENPQHGFTARFLGASNVVPSRVVEEGREGCVVENGFGRFLAPAPEGTNGSSMDLYFRRHEVTPVSDRARIGVAHGRVSSAQFLGDAWQVVLSADGCSVTLVLDAHSGSMVQVGRDASFEVSRCLSFPREGLGGGDAALDAATLVGATS